MGSTAASPLRRTLGAKPVDFNVRISCIISMKNIEVTSVSPKRQAVIPSEIREKMGISTGSKLIVVTDGKNVLLKPIEKPNLAEFEKVLKKSRQLAKKSGAHKKGY